MDEVDAAVKGSGEGGGGWGGGEGGGGRVQLCSRCSSLALWGYADQALKTEARRLWRLGGGEAAFRAGVGAHHTGDEPM